MMIDDPNAPAGPLDNDPREHHEPPAAEPDALPGADGIWRVEPWRGKFLVSRTVMDGPLAKRETDNQSKFSAFANIYEDEETALARAEKLNSEKETSDEQVQRQAD